MRMVIQRVKRGQVLVDDKIVGQIGPGAVVLLGIAASDTVRDAQWCISKLMRLKMWPQSHEEKGSAWKKNIKDVEYSILVVSQFTLHAVFKKPNPDFHKAMGPDGARAMYEQFVALLGEAYRSDRIQTGEFGAMMDVELVNDGPVTFIMDSDDSIPKTPVGPTEDDDRGKTE